MDKNDKLLYEERVFNEDGLAGQILIDSLLKIEDQLQSLNKQEKPMRITPGDLDNMCKETHCHICEIEFNETDEISRDHCHYSGKYLG